MDQSKYKRLLKDIELLSGEALDTKIEDGYVILSLFKSAQIISNQIGFSKLPENECLELKEKLQNAVKSKVLEIAPHFNEKIISSILANTHRSSIFMPMDIMVAGENVFFKDGVLDDFDIIYKVKTSLVRKLGEEFSYKELTNYEEFIINIYKEKKEIYRNYYRTLKEDKIEEIRKFICDSINTALYSKFELAIGINPNKKYDLLYERPYLRIYLTHDFDQICKLINEQTPAEIGMIVMSSPTELEMFIKISQKLENNMDPNDNDTENCDICFYNLTQSFVDEKPIWNAQQMKFPIWSMSEAIKQYKKRKTQILSKCKK